MTEPSIRRNGLYFQVTHSFGNFIFFLPEWLDRFAFVLCLFDPYFRAILKINSIFWLREAVHFWFIKTVLHKSLCTSVQHTKDTYTQSNSFHLDFPQKSVYGTWKVNFSGGDSLCYMDKQQCSPFSPIWMIWSFQNVSVELNYFSRILLKYVQT